MNLGLYLADNAHRTPRKAAVYCGTASRTFAELHLAAQRIASALLEDGLRAGDRVAIHLPNCIEAVELMCGIGCAGGVMVPIPNRLSTDEVAFILTDCEPSFVFHDSDETQALTAAAARPYRTVRVGMESKEWLSFVGREWRAVPPLGAGVEDLVLGYTSGTTGNPKAAIGTHAALIVGSGYMSSFEYDLTAHDVILVTSPVAHRVGLSRVINMLCVGLTAVIMERFNADAAVELIDKHQATCISVVPTIARMLAPAFERHPERCQSLQRLFATGEAFPVELKARLRAALPHLGLHTSYAQTEAGLVTNLRPHEQLERPESIGQAVPGVEVRLVDAQLNDVANGEPGEVMVRCGIPGRSMGMRGYFRRDDANAATFVDDWMRTGDICRRDDDGYFYFVDRLKDMIVTGGLNVYAKEVELCIIAHPGVADAAVVGVPDPDFGEAILAFVECESTSAMNTDSVSADALSADDVVEHCRAHIASYKKPKHIRFVKHLPRTASGKIRKHLLRSDWLTQ